MGAIYYYVVAYLLGGVTFIPLVIAAVFYHAYKTQPVVGPSTVTSSLGLNLSLSEEDEAREHLKSVPADSASRASGPNGVALYFAVCREYVAGGVDGKPPERSMSHATAVQGESPSVYQSMYRSLFERGRAHTPTLEGHTLNSRKTKNVFFVVIRLGLLMLYDNEDQLEVRHVVSLENYNIDVYGGGEPLLEGELWVKRNCIRMTRRNPDDSLAADSRPFFLFSNNCSMKEDFYHAMLLNQSRHEVDQVHPLQFEKDHMVKLFRQLHASEDNLQTRWINAIVGRVFLSLYKTSLLEQIIRNKINKKLSRVVKPAFISAVQIRKIHLGDGAPFITGPKLKELTPEGDLTIEADVKYKGSARIDVAAIARIDLGTRFKAREVELLLAVILKSLEGHMLIRIKAPPSNRIWMSFEGMPKMDMSVEPVISSRQITYGVILRAIESRIREVVNETLVYPNWDDMPFFDTLYHEIRGGIWQHDSAEASSASLSTAPTLVEGGDEVIMQETENPDEAVECAVVDAPAEAILKSPDHKIHNRRTRKAKSARLSKDEKAEDLAMASGAEPHIPAVPKAMRSHSFATAAIPIVTKEPAMTQASSEISRSLESFAASNLKDISSRSQPGTPTDSPVGSPHKGTGVWRRQSGGASITSRNSGTDADPSILIEHPVGKPLASRDEDSAETETFSLHKRQTIASTAAAARKWGLGLLAKNHSPSNSLSSLGSPADPDREEKTESLGNKTGSSKAVKESLEAGTSSIAYGRGMPLPPIGTPLPGPKSDRKSWTAPLAILGRKKNGQEFGPTSQPFPNPASTSSANDSGDSQPNLESSAEIDRPPTLPPRIKDSSKSPSMDDLSKGSHIPRAVKSRHSSRRQRNLSGSHPQPDNQSDSILIISAPEGDTDLDSENLGSPNAPLSPEVSRSTDGVLDIILNDSDLNEYGNDPQLNGHKGPSLTHIIQRKPISHSTLPSLTTAELSGTSPTSLQEPALSSPASIFAETFPADHPIRMRKARSRQSLIPTPTSSRKASPVPQTGSSTLQDLSSKAGRRTSTQSLQDPTKMDRRRSSGFVQ